MKYQKAKRFLPVDGLGAPCSGPEPSLKKVVLDVEKGFPLIMMNSCLVMKFVLYAAKHMQSSGGHVGYVQVSNFTKKKRANYVLRQDHRAI